MKLQILFLKNLKEYHSTSLYFETQSATMQKNFGSSMGNFLKDYPLILGYSPLISFSHQTPALFDGTRIYNLRGNVTAQITEFTAFNKGRIHAIILYDQLDAIESQITSMHVRRGIDLRNVTALKSMQFIVDDLAGMNPPAGVGHFTPESKIWINIQGLPWDPTKMPGYVAPASSLRILEFAFNPAKIFESLKSALKNWVFKKEHTEQAPKTNPLSQADSERLLQGPAPATPQLFGSNIFWVNTMPNTNFTKYTMFYVSTDQIKDDWTQHSVVKKIKFTLFGIMPGSLGKILRVGFVPAIYFVAWLMNV